MRALPYAVPLLLLVVLAMVIFIFSGELRSMRAKFARKVGGAGLAVTAAPGVVISEADIAFNIRPGE